MPGNSPEAALSGKAYNVNDLVTYVEERKLYYPKDQAEFDALRRFDVDFDPSRVGTLGCPLRWPANENERDIANLISNPSAMVDKPPSEISGALGNLIYSAAGIPFVFRLPKDKETFDYNKLPGDFEELRSRYGNEGTVTEMESYKVKKVCVLKGIDQSGKCYLVPVKESHDSSAGCIVVLSAPTN